MAESTIYSTGHGNKEFGDFLEELRSFDITWLMDIRSKPYSKWNPAFNKKELEESLASHGIKYIYAGEVLGGMPEDRAFYDNEGKVLYDLLSRSGPFKEGLRRILNAAVKELRLAVMCSEAKPHECHRSKLIGQELLKLGVSMNHIVGYGRIKSQETVMNELTKGNGTIDLFGKKTDFTSRKSH